MGDDTGSFPHVPLWDRTANLIRIAFQSSLQNYYAADRLAEHFSEAGLPYPICSAKNQSGVARIHLFMVGSLNFWKAFNLNWTE